MQQPAPAPRPSHVRTLRCILVAAVAVLGCDDAADVEPVQDQAGEVSQSPHGNEFPLVADPDGAVPADGEPEVEASTGAEEVAAAVVDAPDEDAIEIQRDREPIEWRISKQRLAVYSEPSKASAIRARIPIHKVFEVFANVEGPGCGEPGWADVGSGGFVCLQETRKAGSQRPKELPPMAGGLTPYFYAKVKENGTVARRWRNLAAYLAGKEPIDTLQKDRDYAFKYRKRHKNTHLLIDESHRVVLESEVHRYRPSRFEGRDLVEKPVPAGQSLAWAFSWPTSSTRREPSVHASAGKSIRYHTELLVDATPIEGPGGPWYRVSDGNFVAEDELRVWIPSTTLPEGIGPDELWIDIDLEMQTLAAMRGSEPIFATLISSGFKRATPRGVFRIHWKQAIGSMASDPGADDPYNVEAVPHVQYFIGGFALHSAYWHNYFGRPISHGCVNLAPTDALRVFRMTSPHVRDGWLMAYETEKGFGTTIRVRKGDRMPRDRRRAPESYFTPEE
jgi:lipoprotein-anchoring transpeptidase ErfK/SrfK